jgi:hypothetical protein
VKQDEEDERDEREDQKVVGRIQVMAMSGGEVAAKMKNRKNVMLGNRSVWPVAATRKTDEDSKDVTIQ